MVSALTNRLHPSGGYSTTGSEDSLSKKRKSDLSNTSGGGSSGYAADDDHVGMSLPPFYVDFQCKSHDGNRTDTTDYKSQEESRLFSNNSNGQQTKTSIKRQKLLEKNFMAQNAKAELSKAGLTMPSLRLKSPRMLPPLCGIDMSRVTLIKASDFQEPSRVAPKVTSLERKSAFVFNAIPDLLQSCRHFYQLPVDAKPSDGERSDDQSSTSSVTDGDTSTGASDDEEAAKRNLPGVMTMCDALSLCKQPRIVVLSTAPFTVVHVNAAFLHMTGLSSVRLLGQPFQDLILDGKWISALGSTTCHGETFDLRKLNKQTIKTRTGAPKGGILQCNVSTSPIGAGLDSITHFALGLESVKDGEDYLGSQSDLEGRAPAMTVTG